MEKAMHKSASNRRNRQCCTYTLLGIALIGGITTVEGVRYSIREIPHEYFLFKHYREIPKEYTSIEKVNKLNGELRELSSFKNSFSSLNSFPNLECQIEETEELIRTELDKVAETPEYREERSIYEELLEEGKEKNNVGKLMIWGGIAITAISLAEINVRTTKEGK